MGCWMRTARCRYRLHNHCRYSPDRVLQMKSASRHQTQPRPRYKVVAGRLRQAMRVVDFVKKASLLRLVGEENKILRTLYLAAYCNLSG